MAAETGSGKTGAFCLPILQIVWETLKDLEQGKGEKGGTVAKTCNIYLYACYLIIVLLQNLEIKHFY